MNPHRINPQENDPNGYRKEYPCCPDISVQPIEEIGSYDCCEDHGLEGFL